MRIQQLAGTLVCCAALVALPERVESQRAAPTSPAPSAKSTAIVTDTKGVTTEVSNLSARYWDERQGDLRLAPDEVPVLVVQVEVQEGRTSATDEMRFPFVGLSKLAFPEYLRLEMTRRNGNVIVIDQLRGPDWTPDLQRSLVERDGKGAIVRELKFHAYLPATNKPDGAVLGAKVMRRMVLGGFTGKARMSTGREGDFFIRWTDVRSIEFK